MSLNDFKAFAISENANVLSQKEYEDLESINEGFRSGIARSEELNKVWRQASTIAAVVAQFMADKSGENVADDGDLEKLRSTLTKALLNNSTSQLDGRYLKSSSNLSDVANAATVRANLGLKGAALQDVGTVSGTVAAGNDSRIVNAAQRGNNLSDLTDKGSARTNLGLGTAALANIQKSSTDATAGALMGVGAFGIGGAEIWIPDMADIYKYFATARSGNYGGGNGLTNALTSGWLSFKWQQHGHEQKYGVLLEIGSSGQVAVHIYHNPNGDMSNPEKYWINSGVIYGEKKKPTAADVGALALTGGTMSGEITGMYKGPFAFADQYHTKAPFYNEYSSTGVSEYRPLFKQQARTTTNAWAFSMGTLLDKTILSWRLHIRGSAGHEVHHQWDTNGNYLCPGQVIPVNYSNFDSRYYTKAQSDAGYMPKVSAYMKYESDSRYVQGIRVSATATRNFNPGAGWSPNDSAFVTAISMVGGMSNTGVLLVRYIQRNINGVWANVVA